MRGRADWRSSMPKDSMHASRPYGLRPPEFYNAVYDVSIVQNVISRISHVGDKSERQRLSEILLRNANHTLS